MNRRDLLRGALIAVAGAALGPPVLMTVGGAPPLTSRIRAALRHRVVRILRGVRLIEKDWQYGDDVVDGPSRLIVTLGFTAPACRVVFDGPGPAWWRTHVLPEQTYTVEFVAASHATGEWLARDIGERVDVRLLGDSSDGYEAWPVDPNDAERT